MERVYTSGKSDSVKLFIGTEVEKTPMHGQKTLFVVGVHHPIKLIDLAHQHGCKHIYFGANHSFVLDDQQPLYANWETWDDMIMTCLDAGFWCTLDLDIRHVPDLAETRMVESDLFIAMISAKVPYARLLGYNAVLKIDDRDFAASNPGVWCHSLHGLQNREAFTDWSKYKQDEVIE